jgi:uncharacterized membrane protein
MDASSFQAARGYRLDTSNDRHGVSCDETGPALGPIRLLTKAASGWQPRAQEELNDLLGKIFAEPVDGASLLPGLRAIARSLDAGNMVRAMIGTQLLHLPVLSEAQARRAMAIKLLAKASPDDPEHPGWPPNTEDGRGGQFRPKNGETSNNARRALVKATRRRLYRRAIREGLRRLLNVRRAARLATELASSGIPVVNVIEDAAMLVDVTDMVSELETLHNNTDVALDFASGGPPQTLRPRRRWLRISPHRRARPGQRDSRRGYPVDQKHRPNSQTSSRRDQLGIRASGVRNKCFRPSLAER